MTFMLALFASLISAMFVATFASSIIAAGREAQEMDSDHRLSIF